MKIKISFVALLLLLTASYPSAGVDGSLPGDMVKKLLDTIKAIKDKDGKISEEEIALNEKLKNTANSLVDVRWLAEWTLGEYWKERSEKEKKDFGELLGSVLKNVAYPKSGKFFRELEVVYDREKIKKEKAVVFTTIIHEKEGEIEIEYKLRLTEGRSWLIYDVVMDGVSLGRNLKTKFRKIVKENSYAELTRRLKKKLVENEIPEGLL